MDEDAHAAAARPDGRKARGERARAAVAEALVQLFAEGELTPTAPRIAERAGVSLRLLYHHFTDLEALWDEVAARQVARVMEHIQPIPRDLPQSARVTALVRQRAFIYEIITPVRRAALLHEPTSSLIAGRLRTVRAVKRAQLREVFAPELDPLQVETGQELFAALAAAASWATWESLRSHQALTVEQATAVVSRTLRALLQFP